MKNIKNNFKHALIITGAAAATILPLKSAGAWRTQSPKENTVEITVNPAQERERIRVLAADSARIANTTRVSAHLQDYIALYDLVAPKLSQEMIRHMSKDAPLSKADFQKLFDLWANQQNIINEIIGTTEYIENEIKWAVPNEKNPDAINQELAELRLLLKLATQRQK